jgi:hypothetical protein
MLRSKPRRRDMILTGSARLISRCCSAALIASGQLPFGMPLIDLLFLGALGEVCVIGLPGCAISCA